MEVFHELRGRTQTWNERRKYFTLSLSQIGDDLAEDGQMSERVGVVGLGLMGSAFTHHLVQSGFQVQGYDIDEKRGRELNERGGAPVESPAATARGARWVVTSLPNSDIVREVVLGRNGI